MTKNVKCLITGGCSFSQPNNTDITWVHHLQDYIQPDKVVHTGIGAAGNGLISRRIISAVTEQLKTYKPDEMLVGIMWSEFKRRDYYSIADLETTNTAPRRYYWYSNPTAGYVPEEYYWYVINPHWSDPLTTKFKENFYNYEDSLINCFEHVLRVQWFLQANNIPYFMTEFDYSAFDEFPFARNWKNNAEIKFLWDQIDKSHWLPVENCYQWCKEKSGKEFARPPDPHPSTAQHREFVNKVIVPYLLEKHMLYDIIV